MNKNREPYTFHLTHPASVHILTLDTTLVGTDDYMGYANFWHHDYRHSLRQAPYSVRQTVHDALRHANLTVDGNTPEHSKIIYTFVKE